MTDAARTNALGRPDRSSGIFRRRPLAVRLARIVALAVIIGIGFNHVWWAITDWHLSDMSAYWDAGMRLRLGEALYPRVTDVIASEVYRYSPWFAWLWAPLTLLPRAVVEVAWSAILLAASIAAIWPMARSGAWIGVAFFLPILVGISAIGNVHALLIATLVLSVQRRSGPVWIAVAASLKIFPILLVIPYLGRREWGKAAATLVITMILLSPYLLYDLSNYVTSTGGGGLLSDLPIAYGAAVLATMGAALLLARTRWAWLAASAAVVIAIPRSFLYDVSWILVGAPDAPPKEAVERAA